MTNPILETKNLGIDFGGLTAVNNLNLYVNENEIVGLIGPNGAGKTTVFNLLTKVYNPSRGSVLLCGKDIKKSNTIVANIDGIARTFQNIRLFSNISVIDNVKSAMSNLYKYSIFDTLLHTKKYKENEKFINEKAEELLNIFNLINLKDVNANSLPYGAQRRLEIARALATNPKVLLLDEPAAGMNPNETQELMDTIALIRKEFNMTVLLIEHDMKLVSGICEKLTVLNFGRVLAQGKTEEVLNNPEVIKAYLGE